MNDLEVAIKAIVKASEIIAESYGNFSQLDFKSDIDVVTEVDFRCEEAISEILRKETPDYGIIAEEGTNFPGEKVWIVDPLDGTINFASLKKQNYYDARDDLCQVFGIGKKVADCILLFSLDKLEAVPLDRWVLRILQKYYSREFEIKTKSITEKTYDELHEKIIDYFGEYAGYAQQFLFKNERESSDKKWLG